MKAVAQAQPNIALIKYWGKRNHEKNLPAVGSLSLTLDTLRTTMSVDFSSGAHVDELSVNDAPTPAMLSRVSRCLDLVVGADRRRANVISTGNFPIGAGLASSASAFAALVVAAAKARAKNFETSRLAQLAGSSSGSAARSLYGGVVELFVDEDEISVRPLLNKNVWPLQVIAAVTSAEAKPIGSSEAMIRGEKTSPFYSTWIERQNEDLQTARDAIRARDFVKLAGVAEHNCLKMHSVMWSSWPSIVYWNSATLACLETIRALQQDGHAVFFTIDAGPQVKAVCLPESLDVAQDALRQTPGVVSLLCSGLGDGARLIETV